MSEFYEDEEIVTEPREDKLKSEAVAVVAKPPRVRYQSINDQTKRRNQAIINLAKGRATRLANLKKRKEVEKYSYDVSKQQSDSDNDDDSYSSEEIMLTKSKPRKIPVKPQTAAKRLIEEESYITERMDKMEQLIMMQMRQAKKKTRPIKQTIVQIPNQSGAAAYHQPANNPQLQNTKKYLLDL